MQNASQGSSNKVFIIMSIVFIVLLCIAGIIVAAVFLTQDNTVVECTKNSDCQTGNVCTNSLCVKSTQSRTSNTSGNTTGGVFVTSLTDGCYIDASDGKTYKIDDGVTCYINNDDTVGNICGSTPIRSNLDDITGGVAWNDPGSTLRACTVPQQSTTSSQSPDNTSQSSNTFTSSLPAGCYSGGGAQWYVNSNGSACHLDGAQYASVCGSTSLAKSLAEITGGYNYSDTQAQTCITSNLPTNQSVTSTPTVAQGTVSITQDEPSSTAFKSSLPSGCYSGGGAQWYVNANGSPCHLDGTQFASVCGSTSTASSLPEITGGYNYNDEQAQRCTTSNLPTTQTSTSASTTQISPGIYTISLVTPVLINKKYLQAYAENTIIHSLAAPANEVQNWFIKPVAGKTGVYTITSMYGDNNRLVWRDPTRQNIVRAWSVNVSSGRSEWQITGNPISGYTIVDPVDGYHLGTSSTNYASQWVQAYAVNSPNKWNLTPTTIKFGDNKICAQNINCTSGNCSKLSSSNTDGLCKPQGQSSLSNSWF